MIDHTADSELPIKLEQERSNLSFEIAKWRKQQHDVMPDVLNHLPPSRLSPSESTSIEHEQLLLPSDLSPPEREKCGVTHLVHQELELRRGQAHDALRSLRAQVKYVMALSRQKNSRQNAIHGQYLNTRAGAVLSDAIQKRDGYKQKYRRTREAMIRLGMSSEEFPELNDADLWRKDPLQYHKLGDGQKTEGWIWRVGLPQNMSDDEREEYLEDSTCHHRMTTQNNHLLFRRPCPVVPCTS